MKFEFDDQKLEKHINNVLAVNYKRAGLLMEAQLKKKLSTQGTGRTYDKGSVKHTASAAGEPPAPDTGVLRASIKYAVFDDTGTPTLKVGSDLDTLKKSQVGSFADYGFLLEVGRPGVKPRPWLIPTLQENKRNLLRIIEGR